MYYQNGTYAEFDQGPVELGRSIVLAIDVEAGAWVLNSDGNSCHPCRGKQTLNIWLGSPSQTPTPVMGNVATIPCPACQTDAFTAWHKSTERNYAHDIKTPLMTKDDPTRLLFYYDGVSTILHLADLDGDCRMCRGTGTYFHWCYRVGSLIRFPCLVCDRPSWRLAMGDYGRWF